MKNPDLMEAKEEVNRINHYVTLGESLLQRELSGEEITYVQNNLETLRELLVAYKDVVESNRVKFFSDAEIVSEGRNPTNLEDLLKEDVSSLEWGVRLSKIAKCLFLGLSYLPIPKLKQKTTELANLCGQRTQRYEERLRNVKGVKALEQLQKERKKEYYEKIKEQYKKSNTEIDEDMLNKFSENPLLLIYSTFEVLKETHRDPLEGEYDYLRPEND